MSFTGEREVSFIPFRTVRKQREEWRHTLRIWNQRQQGWRKTDPTLGDVEKKGVQVPTTAPATQQELNNLIRRIQRGS